MNGRRSDEEELGIGGGLTQENERTNGEETNFMNSLNESDEIILI
jgi:hypothetical protein